MLSCLSLQMLSRKFRPRADKRRRELHPGELLKRNSDIKYAQRGFAIEAITPAPSGDRAEARPSAGARG